MSTARYRPFQLLCPRCRGERDVWARTLRRRPTESPEPCPACVERCDAERFNLAAQGKDPVMTYHRADGTVEEFLIVGQSRPEDL